MNGQKMPIVTVRLLFTHSGCFSLQGATRIHYLSIRREPKCHPSFHPEDSPQRLIRVNSTRSFPRDAGRTKPGPLQLSFGAWSVFQT
jgi:hypothetical protein